MPALTTNLDQSKPYALALFRIVVGLLFACHGASSLFGVFGGHLGTGESLPTGLWPNWYAGVIQLVCGSLVAAGLFTRVTAVIASGSMAYAYFVVHQPTALLPLQNDGESSAMYCWAFLLLTFTGPGALALGSLGAHRTAQPAPQSAAAA